MSPAASGVATKASSIELQTKRSCQTFGIGLIVDVRRGQGSEVLEVVFGSELKRLSAKIKWQIADDAAVSRDPEQSTTAEETSLSTPSQDLDTGVDGDSDVIPEEKNGGVTPLLFNSTPESR